VNKERGALGPAREDRMAQPEYTTYPEVVAWWRANPTATLYECRRACRVSAEKATEARREALATRAESPVTVPPISAEGIYTPPAEAPAFQSGTAPASGPARAPDREGTSNLTRDIQGETSRTLPLYQGEDSVWVVFGDVHLPFEDKGIVEKLLWFLRMLKPDGVIANGDILDFYELSKFSKDPRRKTDTCLNTEFEKGRAFLQSVTNASGARWRIYHEGNHEARYQRYLAERAPELATLRNPAGDYLLTLEHQLELEARGWQHKPYKEWTTLGDLDVEHGENVSKPAAMPAGQTIRNVLIRRNRSTLMNHIHTVADAVNTSRGGAWFEGIENGCLCDLEPEYDRNARWSHGWSVVIVRDGLAFVEQVKARNGRILWRGEIL
jgi:hypothetical protein